MCYSELLVTWVCSIYILGLRGKQNEYLMAFYRAKYEGEHNYITVEHFAIERECKLSWHVSTWKFIFVRVQPETNPPNTHPHMLTHTQPCRSEYTCIQTLKHTHEPNKRGCLYKQTDSGFSIKVLLTHLWKPGPPYSPYSQRSANVHHHVSSYLEFK